MSRYWNLDGYNRSGSCCIIWKDGRKRRGDFLRPEYTDLTCADCGRVDVLKSLRRGIVPNVKIPRTPGDYFRSDDRLNVMSSRMKEAFEGIRGVRLKYFAIPESDWWVAWPAKVFYSEKQTGYHPVGGIAVESDALEVSGPTCGTCGRIRELRWKSDRFHVPHKVAVAGVYLQVAGIASTSLIISDAVKEVLESAELKRWRAHPIGP